MPVMFDTPGELDIRAFTTFGLHAKPNTTNPIGKFGSGLKNAIAVLVREGIKVRVFIGTTEYEFYCMVTEFRGQEFKQIRLKKRHGLLSKWRYEELPFTTAHAKHWTLWQAFRELESNTRDEQGFTTFADVAEVGGLTGRTLIIVNGKAFDEVYQDRDTIFLPGALTVREDSAEVQVFNENSKHIYWRGVRVFDLELPSIYTYNIVKDLTITEDRTIKYMYEVQAVIAAHVAKSKDSRLINSVVSADGDKFFEGRLDFDYTYASPSDEFKEVIAKKKYRGAYVSPRALTYYDRYTPRPPADTEGMSVEEELVYWSEHDSTPDRLKRFLHKLRRDYLIIKSEPLPPATPLGVGVVDEVPF